MIPQNNERPIQPPSAQTGLNNRLVNRIRRRNNIISVLMSVHAIWVIGISFVIGVTQGILSPTFGYTAGIGDILIGVTALTIAYFFKKGNRLATNVSIVWNILGMIDLVVAIYLGITSSNTQLSAANPHPAMTTIPWVLIPTVGVPILMTIHIITLWLLRGKNTKR